MALTAAEIQRKLAENAATVNEQIASSCCNSDAMVRWCDPRKVPALLDEIISYGKKSEVVAAVRESVEEVQTQAVSDHDNHVGMCQQLQRSVDDLMQRDSGSDGRGVSRSQRADAKDENAA